MQISKISQLGVLLLCGLCFVVLGGFKQDCIDIDGDGYGPIGAGGCPPPCEPATDCDDSNAEVNPDMTKGPEGDSTCSDNLDNDCDGFADSEDSQCSDESLWDEMIWGQDNWGN